MSLMPDALMAMGIPLDDIAHIVQVALTPVFLLSGIGSLLNVINTRRTSIADRFEASLHQLDLAEGRRARLILSRLHALRRQILALDLARASGALAGLCICIATFVLFLGGLQNMAIATALFVAFGLSVLFTMISLAGLFAEAMFGWGRLSMLAS